MDRNITFHGRIGSGFDRLPLTDYGDTSFVPFCDAIRVVSQAWPTAFVTSGFCSPENKKSLMQNIQLHKQEIELMAFDPQFFNRLHKATPLLAYMVANAENIQFATRYPYDREKAWGELRGMSNFDVARKVGIPVQILRKISLSELACPTLTDDLAMLCRVLRSKHRCARFLRHAKKINLNTARAMYMIDCDDSKLWEGFNELPCTTAGSVTDVLVVIHHILRQSGRRWQSGMVRGEVTLAYTYERLLAVKLPEPPFVDDPQTIIACRTGVEISSWGLFQRNCAASHINSCIAGGKVIYKMIHPSPATILIALDIPGWPKLADARGHANSELTSEQLAVLWDWCGKNGIDYSDWLAEGAR